MRKTFKDTEMNIEIDLQECTAIPYGIGEKERVDAIYVDYYTESREHFEFVVFNWEMPKNQEEFEKMQKEAEYYEWDSYYKTIESVILKK